MGCSLASLTTLSKLLVTRRAADPTAADPRADRPTEMRALLRQLRETVLQATSIELQSVGGAAPADAAAAVAAPGTTRTVGKRCKALLRDWAAAETEFIGYGRIGLERSLPGTGNPSLPSSGLFCVCEKVHGANFVVSVARGTAAHADGMQVWEDGTNA